MAETKAVETIAKEWSFIRKIENSYTWNGDLPKAANRYDRAAVHALGSYQEAIYSYFCSKCHWIMALLSEDNGPAVKTAISSLSQAELSLDKHLTAKTSLTSNNGGSPSEKVAESSFESMRSCLRACIGDILIMRSLLQLRKGNWFRGGLGLRKGWKMQETMAMKIPSIVAFLASIELLDGENDTDDDPLSAPDIPEAIDAPGTWGDRILHSTLLFTLGAVYFFVSLVPPSFAWLVELVGFHGDRDGGLRLLKAAASVEGPCAPMAQLLLVWINTFFYDDCDAAQSLLESAEQSFPDGTTHK